MTSSYSKTSISVRPHQQDNPAFSSLHSGDGFRNLSLLVPENAVKCGHVHMGPKSSLSVGKEAQNLTKFWAEKSFWNQIAFYIWSTASDFLLVAGIKNWAPLLF